jgi:ketosteroid isomerase-like protein
MLSSRLVLASLVALTACATKDARRTDTSAAAAATLAGAPAADSAAVRQSIDAGNARYSNALMQGDTATVAGLYTDDALVMAANMPAARGHDAIAKNIAGLISAMKLSSFKLQTQDVILAGEYAIETGANELTGVPAKATKPTHNVGKYLVIWKKQADGSYKILRDIANSDLSMK